MKTTENNECFLKETIEIQARTLPVQKKMLQRNKVASFTEGTAALKKKKKKESRSDYFQRVQRNSMRVSRQSQKG